MNRKKMIEILFSNYKYTQEHKDIILQLEEAKIEWEVAKKYFGVADDPKLVDYAIYREDQCKAKYIYFLLEAKRKGVTIDASYMIEEMEVVDL
jgi:hypothetical protein